MDLIVLTPEAERAIQADIDELKQLSRNRQSPSYEPITGKAPDVYVAMTPEATGLPGRVGSKPGHVKCCLFKLTWEFDSVTSPAQQIITPLLGPDGQNLREEIYNIYSHYIPGATYFQVYQLKTGLWVCERPDPFQTSTTSTTQNPNTTTTPHPVMDRPCVGSCRHIWNAASARWIEDVNTCTNSPTTTRRPTTTTSTTLCPCPSTTTSSAPTTSTSSTSSSSTTTTTPIPCGCSYPSFCGTEDGECYSSPCTTYTVFEPICGQTTTSRVCICPTTTTPAPIECGGSGCTAIVMRSFDPYSNNPSPHLCVEKYLQNISIDCDSPCYCNFGSGINYNGDGTSWCYEDDCTIITVPCTSPTTSNPSDGDGSGGDPCHPPARMCHGGCVWQWCVNVLVNSILTEHYVEGDVDAIISYTGWLIVGYGAGGSGTGGGPGIFMCTDETGHAGFCVCVRPSHEGECGEFAHGGCVLPPNYVEPDPDAPCGGTPTPDPCYYVCNPTSSTTSTPAPGCFRCKYRWNGTTWDLKTNDCSPCTCTYPTRDGIDTCDVIWTGCGPTTTSSTTTSSTSTTSSTTSTTSTSSTSTTTSTTRPPCEVEAPCQCYYRCEGGVWVTFNDTCGVWGPPGGCDAIAPAGPCTENTCTQVYCGELCETTTSSTSTSTTTSTTTTTTGGMTSTTMAPATTTSAPATTTTAAPATTTTAEPATTTTPNPGACGTCTYTWTGAIWARIAQNCTGTCDCAVQAGGPDGPGPDRELFCTEP